MNSSAANKPEPRLEPPASVSSFGRFRNAMGENIEGNAALDELAAAIRRLIPPILPRDKLAAPESSPRVADNQNDRRS